jgi:hypothetical protein
MRNRVGIDVSLENKTAVMTYQCKSFWLNRMLGAPYYYNDVELYVTDGEEFEDDEGSVYYKWWYKPSQHIFHPAKDIEINDLLNETARGNSATAA